ncbi:diguanylate cyclase [Marinomonas sp. THO17]|uniref:GGDEF domain-containing response regulator n=1 Tax=Marinomonas sp. THO17 TaxID=3149048 RepID=UPI00336BC947
MKVLIADDTNTDRLLLKLLLSKLGCDVIEARDGLEVIEEYQSHINDIDLILVDVQMPKMNGFAAVKQIRSLQQEGGQEWFPIIFLSASDEEGDIEDAIHAGGDDYLIKPISQKILSAKMLAMRRIADMRGRLVASNKMLEELASTDHLTGVANRRSFEVMLDDALESVDSEGISIACGIFDLDKFKHINDAYGHDVGDKVLIEISNCVRDNLSEKDKLGRLGGEEFGLILFDDHQDKLVKRLEHIRSKVEECVIKSKQEEIKVTISMGAVVLSPELNTKRKVLKRADELLYKAKDQGRNRLLM